MLWVRWFWLTTALAGAPWDSVHPSHTLERVAFGSCNKQQRPQPLWPLIAEHRPSLFLWCGDAIYPYGRRTAQGRKKHAAVEGKDLAGAYALQLRNDNYTRFLRNSSSRSSSHSSSSSSSSNSSSSNHSSSGGSGSKGVLVEGVFDDHDYGCNDAGRELPFRGASQRHFLDFLAASNDLSGANNASSRADSLPSQRGRQRHDERAGMYSSHLFGPPGRRVAVLLLDTRYHRDLHYLPSAASARWLPFGAVLAALGRWLCAACGLGLRHRGDVLGEAQWAWLEAVLRESSGGGGGGGSDDGAAAFHIIVSSVQLHTSSPFVESWGHFPAAKRRLLRLLGAHRPRGAVFLSGDVHFAELLGGGGGSAAAKPVLEVTSSGLTHHVGLPWWRAAARWVLRAFPGHRPRADAYYVGLNFGTLRFDWAAAAGEEKEKEEEEEQEKEKEKEEGLQGARCGGGGGGSGACLTVDVRDAAGVVRLSASRTAARYDAAWDAGMPPVISEHGGAARARVLSALALVLWCASLCARRLWKWSALRCRRGTQRHPASAAAAVIDATTTLAKSKTE